MKCVCLRFVFSLLRAFFNISIYQEVTDFGVLMWKLDKSSLLKKTDD